MADALHPKTLLAGLEQRARRRFGQHFLHESGVVERIVRAARIQPGDRVLEVGPGLGVLTRGLLAAQADLTAVELDRDLAAFLRENLPNLRLVEGDALTVDLAEVCPGTGWKVVANLPYNVGTHLVRRWVDDAARFESLTVMLQKEVVDRLLAEPDTREYGALTVQIAARARGRVVTAVPPGCFYPPPKVDSAVVQLFPHAPETGGVDPDFFDKVVRASFARRRKTIRNSLSSEFPGPAIDAALERAGVSPGIRAEVLDIAAFRGIAAGLSPSGA
jgi:16S rRNA (adenine1518-N6/adenine1519-N6)-dimethyltransferase